MNKHNRILELQDIIWNTPIGTDEHIAARGELTELAPTNPLAFRSEDLASDEEIDTVRAIAKDLIGVREIEISGNTITDIIDHSVTSN